MKCASLFIAFACALANVNVAVAADRDDFGRRASWQIPEFEQVSAQTRAWLDTQPLDETTRAEIDAHWAADAAPGEPAALLLHLADTIARVEPRAAELLNFCRNASPPLSPPAADWLRDEALSPWVRHNLRFVLARWLVEQSLYDEAAEQLAGLQPADVVDPAGLLFYQSIVHHRLLEKKACLDRLALLLEQESTIPRRYATVARLMEADIKPLEVDSLDEVARLMDDIERRLRLSRAGKRVRQQEDDVVAKLDKMIEDLEKQQQQQQQQSSASQGGSQSNSPAQDSMPLGGSGPGDVDQKDIGDKSGWGNLPPKERQEALQRISKDLPAHFREVVEEYFRKLASEGGGE